MSASPYGRRTLRLAAIASLMPAIALLAAFSPPRTARTPASNVVTVTAKEYGFVAPDTLVAGPTTIRLLNRGMELHHVQLIRLGGGHTLKDLFDALKAGGPPPQWSHMVGGPNAPVPGAETMTSLDLAPGRYAMVCFIPSGDGAPHVMKGMAKELTVVAAKGRAVVQAGSSAPTSTITLTDYHFALSSPLRSGTSVVRVTNAAKQGHELLVVKLAPGKTAGDFVSWVDKQAGPPPGATVGGTTAMDAGVWNDMTLRLTPGEYALLCFVPDAKDGKPHVMHGMSTQFSVK